MSEKYIRIVEYLVQCKENLRVHTMSSSKNLADATKICNDYIEEEKDEPTDTKFRITVKTISEVMGEWE